MFPSLPRVALRLALPFACLAAAATSVVACGSDAAHNADYGVPPDAGQFNPGNGAGGGGYGEAGSPQPGQGGTPFDAGPPTCSDDLKRCAQTFTYPFAGETTVELRGDYGDGKWVKGDAMTHAGGAWTVTVPVPWDKAVGFKFFVNGTDWKIDPAQPTVTDATNNTNNTKAGITCPASFTCDEPPVPPVGVYDWRDAVVYFVFVDRFLDGNPANNCTVAGADGPGNYEGGDWVGVTQKITDGYFTDLGVNTLWITVPIKNADTFAGHGVGADTHMYSAYHGYWPSDPTRTEDCFGTAAELKALVDAAHAKGLKVLFDYAMVHVQTSSDVFKTNPSWFWPSTKAGHDCICGQGCDWNADGQQCWFTDYLAHFNYTVQAARDYSVGNAIKLVQDTGADAFRLDAIKQVDPSWMTSLRTQLASQVLATQPTPQRFYMVGETYDFQNRGLIKSLLDPQTKLDGQFDFPFRIRLVEAVLMRSTQNLLTPDDLNWSRTARSGMAGLSDFLDVNDGYYGSDAVMSTFVGNHDLPRSIHYAEDTPVWSDSAADGKNLAWAGQPGTSTNPRAYERLANAYAVMLTDKGAPLIYYGDEIGLAGAGDPDNRRMMQFTGLTASQQGLHDRIKALAAIRAAHPSLRRGHRTTLFVDADLWVFQMTTTGDTVYVAINRSDTDRQVTQIPAGLTELLTSTPSAATSTIPARQTRIYK